MKAKRGYRLQFAAIWFLCLSTVLPVPAQAAVESAIVINAITGEVIYSANADAQTFPASLAKMMTLYLTFEALEQGKLKLTTPLTITQRAAAQPPSKLGLTPGQTLSVQEAILGLVTKSANDAAMVLSEGLGGTEETFAQKMTTKARQLGMSETTFRNSSGLYHSQQVTTARDMAKLGSALIRDFPKQYAYFSTPSFTYRGTTYTNHNGLLGRYEGADGLKTGYIDASGFNLAASVQRGNLRLVGVVMGGRTASARDKQMAGLFDVSFNRLATLQYPGATTQKSPQLAATTPGQPTARAAVQTPPRAAATAKTPTPAAKQPEPQVAAKTVAKTPTPAPATPARPQAPVVANANEAGGGWAIQAGAYKDVDLATKRLAQVTAIVGGMLHQPASMVLPEVTTGVHRVRIAQLSQTEARNACRALEGKGMGCVVISPGTQQNDLERNGQASSSSSPAPKKVADAEAAAGVPIAAIARLLQPKDARSPVPPGK